eukprot:TRINITY_DN11674_c3_g2_i1.p1 TRINITY_DN11674_c3_g2~~TRINITY_DN11674_c3_g2_i1.p1  ORF type:complete len:1089 (+),score=318.58 TRINITY_DN11674_c3_g2_i1:255-3269(+)
MAGETFSHVFGTNIAPLERFLMKRDLMGPCWLQIKNVKAATKNLSWCKVEALCTNPKDICKVEDPPASPPLTVMTLSMQTILNNKSHVHEILAVTGLVHQSVNLDGYTPDPEKGYSNFTALRKLGDNPFPFDLNSKLHQKKRRVETMASERALLAYFLAKVQNIDPDVIVGHNISGFDLDVLMHRIKTLNIPHWSRIGRLRRNAMPNLKANIGNQSNVAMERDLVSGRLMLDTQTSARELIRQVSYALTDLVSTQLGAKRVEIEQESIPKLYAQTPTLIQMIDHVERDAYLIMSLLFKLNILPLMKQITNITGGIMSRTLSRGRSDRNEFLLCHEFHRRKYIVPDKPGYKEKQPKNKKKKKGKAKDDDEEEEDGGRRTGTTGRKKPAYSGGLVLEPKKGFYDKFILLLDFNSLYPSIIQEYNLCFTTVSRHDLVNEDGDERLAEVPDSSLDRGVLPKVLRTLILKRKTVKQLIKQESSKAKLAEYDIQQKALKLTANSMYGCLGFSQSRFYAKPIAALITAKGREILQKTVDLTQDKLGLEVIYGDTDSIMVNSKSVEHKEAIQIANQVKREVNSLYTELEIDLDGIYKTMLLLKKKKYAALMMTNQNGKLVTTKEVKGLDIVRRDWSALAHDVGNWVLNQILNQDQDSAESLVETCHDYLRSVAEDVKTEGRVPLEKFIIYKSLTKEPSAYSDAKALPHVQVALRMKATGKSVRALDTIPYVVCEDGTSNAATQRAYHPDDLRKQGNLKIDVEYYLKNQVHPVVSRMVEPIEGTDNAQIAECLGLDPSSFKQAYSHQDNEDDELGILTTQLSDEERFKTAVPLEVICQECGYKTDFPGVFRFKDGTRRCGLLCPNPDCAAVYNPVKLCNLITMQSRKYIQMYYEGHLICDDPACSRGNRSTRQLSVRGRRCLGENCRGTMQQVYTDKMLYTQLAYYKNLFDALHCLDQLKPEEKQVEEAALTPYKAQFHQCYSHAERLLNKSARRHVQLGQLFACIAPKQLFK